MLKKVRIDKAVGMALGHDVTKVVPGEFKGPGFRRGHLIKEEDLPALHDIGEEHVYVMELGDDEVHEEDAALRIAEAISGPNLEIGAPSEGKVEIRAESTGVLSINTSLLEDVNALEETIVATLHDHTVCQVGTVVAATRIIPLFTAETKVCRIERMCQERGKIVEVAPFEQKRIGVVITGTEVFEGRIRDGFGKVIQRKAAEWGSFVSRQVIVPDDADQVALAVSDMGKQGCDVIVVCGGFSVDPDDVSVEGIIRSGTKTVSYGAPVLPGAMFFYGMWQDIPVLGAPACVIYSPRTILDLILPRVLAGERLSREDIVSLGHGGLCLGCDQCSFPVCPFGK